MSSQSRALYNLDSGNRRSIQVAGTSATQPWQDATLLNGLYTTYKSSDLERL